MKTEQNPILYEALAQLSRYVEEAEQFGDSNADCCFLASTGVNNRPSVRIITIQKINDNGLLFLANKNSGKTKQFNENPYVGLCFYWPEIKMQATIEGTVAELEKPEAEELWKKRDYHAQITAWAIDSMNEQEGINPASFDELTTAAKKRFEGSKPPLSSSWTGYIIEPNRIEFWNTDWKKNKKRECYTKNQDEWEKREFY